MILNKLLLQKQVVTQHFINSETGVQTEIVIPKGNRITIAIKSSNDDNVTLKMKMVEDGEDHIIEEYISNDFIPRSIEGGMYSIFLEIITNTSNNILLEVSSYERK